ncbi:MAG TPA: PfkB family carbohydrate kinase [Nocardioidaceae bacterium]|nr:PfkB family carbohydrate kinase [Nocardioidaceae bacterium]
MNARLHVVGSVIIDVTLQVPRLPEPGGDVLGRDGRVTPGGSLNVMAAARRQGVPVTYAGTHGRGPFGDLVRGALHAERIEVLHPAHEHADTGFDVAVTDDHGERTFLTSLGAESLLTAGLLTAVRPAPGDAVYVSGYTLARPEPAAAVAGWLPSLADEVVVLVDPGPLVRQLPAAELDTVLRRADWCSCSAPEASALTDAAEPSAAAHMLLRRTGRRGVVVRDGARGAVLALRGATSTETLPAPVVHAVDSNGAGDAHVGVFAAAVLAGMAPQRAVRRANAAAAIAVTRRGPATAPTTAELDGRCPDRDRNAD